MRAIHGLTCLLLLALPGLAHGQAFVVQGAGGPTITDAGHSLAAGMGFSPNAHVTALVTVERTHLSGWTRTDEHGWMTRFRGGTLTLGSAELQVVPFVHRRVAPYGLVGIGAGVSRPNVNAMFPERITNDVRVVFAGGGIRVPVGNRIGVFADARMMLGAEGIEGVVAVAPLRAGVVWRF